jgi:hypothetical protein
MVLMVMNERQAMLDFSISELRQRRRARTARLAAWRLNWGVLNSPHF